MLSLNSEKSKAIKQLYQNSAIRTRYSVISDFTKDRSDWDFWGSDFPKKIPGMSQRNDLYKIEAPKLAYEAAAKALKAWGGDPDTISHVISVSCTGMVAPGIEFDLMRLIEPEMRLLKDWESTLWAVLEPLKAFLWHNLLQRKSPNIVYYWSARNSVPFIFR